MHLEIKNIGYSFGKNLFSLRNISFEAGKGEIVALLGESGSGKTTLMRLIAGFEQPAEGTVVLDGCMLVSDTVFVQPEKRNVGIVFQDHSLFPHLTVEKNIAFGCRQNKTETVEQLLQLTGLPEMKKRYPHELSGGQQQRIAIARALAPDPELLILDEPFSNLDIAIKSAVRNDLHTLLKKTGKTTLLVTHDINDCLALADKMMILQNGKIIQSGTLDEIYSSPASLYVAQLFGKISKLPRILCPDGEKDYFIRPKNVELTSDPGAIQAKVTNCRFIGENHEISLLVENSELVAWSENKIEIDIFTGVKADVRHLIQFNHE